MHWIARIEAEYGQSIHELLESERDLAATSGISLPMLAEEWGCTYWQLHHLCRKLEIKWPRHISSRLKERAAEMGRINGGRNAKDNVTLDGITMSVSAHAKRLGRCRKTVWWRMKRGKMSAEDALSKPSVSRKERGEKGMQSRYGRAV